MYKYGSVLLNRASISLLRFACFSPTTARGITNANVLIFARFRRIGLWLGDSRLRALTGNGRWGCLDVWISRCLGDRWGLIYASSSPLSHRIGLQLIDQSIVNRSVELVTAIAEMKATLSICGLLLLPLVQAHYKLLRPAPREFDTSKEGSGPCGGSTTPASNRSTWSLDGDTISLSMGHDHSRLQILLGLGNDPGNSFNIPILPTSQQEGMGALCLQSLRLPAGVNAMDGQNGTIQIITSNESGGGLYVVRWSHPATS